MVSASSLMPLHFEVSVILSYWISVVETFLKVRCNPSRPSYCYSLMYNELVSRF
jgi:hypothetical protein